MQSIHKDSPEDRYRALEVDAYRMGNNAYVIRSKSTRAARIVSPQTAALLGNCMAFRTLDQHIRVFATSHRLPFTSIAALRAEIKTLTEEGFLLSERALLERISLVNASYDDNSSIAAIAIPTCNRVDLLERAITSCMENTQRHERRVDFVVMDDSRTPAAAQANREILQSLSRQRGVPIRYAGSAEKDRFAAALVAELDCDPELIRFALAGERDLGATHGANRNAVLLDLVGKKYITFDDDMICRFCTIPTSSMEDGLTFCASVTQERWFFRDEAEAEQARPIVEKDLVGLHEAWLGKSLADCVRALPREARVEFDNINSAFVDRVRSGFGQVAVTMPGHWGDSGLMQTQNYFYLMSKGETFDRLTQSEEVYRAAFMSRQVLNGVLKPTIGAGSPATGMCQGHDARSVMPPFMPVLRGSDSTFGTMLWVAAPDAHFAHLPYALRHAPGKDRGFSLAESWRDQSGTKFAELLGQWCLTFDSRPDGRSRPQRLCDLGRFLIELGALRRSDFEERSRSLMWERRNLGIQLLEQRLVRTKGLPSFWAEDARTFLQLQRDAFPKDEFYIPYDLRNGHDRDTASALTQTLIKKLGALVRIWPDVSSAAQKLRDKGCTLTQPV